MGRRFKAGCLVLVVLAASASGQGYKALGKPNKSIGNRVMAVGDSITLGAGATGGYRAILEGRLRSQGYRFEFVGGSRENSSNLLSPFHEGHGGWSTTDLTSGRADQRAKGKLSDWLRAHRPDTVLVMAGTNDNPWVTRQEWTAKYERLLDAVFRHDKGIKVVLASIPKSDHSVTGKDWAEALCFDIVKKVAASRRSRGFRVAFADTYTSFNPQTDLADAYHPNVNGYRKIANAFFGALVKG